MSYGRLLAMPFLVLNMSGEMLYILNQRLESQKISVSKTEKVMFDIAKNIFNPKFLDELFQSQEIYSYNSIKVLFEKLVHSSTMTLNTFSMDKLFDLIFMGTKFQFFSVINPQEILSITIKKIESIAYLIGEHNKFPELHNCIDRLIKTYSVLTEHSWFTIHSTLINFFKDKKLKISLFLQNKLQDSTGSFLIDTRTGKLPVGGEIVGTIRYYEANRVAQIEEFSTPGKSSLVESKDFLNINSSNGYNIYSTPSQNSSGSKQGDEIVPSRITFSYFRPPNKPFASLVEASQLINKFNHDLFGENLSSLSAPKYGLISNSCPGSKYSSEVSARAELNLLSSLLGRSNLDAEDSKPIKLDFFNNVNNNSVMFSDSKSSRNEQSDDIIIFELDAASEAKSFEKYMQDLNLGDDLKSDSKNDEDDDLLALMDSAK